MLGKLSKVSFRIERLSIRGSQDLVRLSKL